MANGDILVYIGVAINISVLFIIIWDHIKDDRILSMQIQEFYEDIESLIFTNLQVKYYEALETVEGKMEAQELSALKKNKNRDIIQQNYLSTKILQHFELYSQYLGLTYNSENQYYLNGTVYILKTDGVLLKRNFETNVPDTIVESYTEIKKEKITEILNFLNSLRFQWKKRYKKAIFRPDLQQTVNYDNLLGYTKPLDQKSKGRRRIIKRKVKN